MEEDTARKKIVLPNQLARINQSMRYEEKRLVLTNGCFDLLHVGHIQYLCQARRLGDALAIGLNSDASVRKLKGSGRPLVPQIDRAAILAALECVDFVAIFEEETAVELVREVRPAIYVKGGDYSSDPSHPAFPVEGRIVGAYGGLVKILEYTHGKSTSALLARIREMPQPGPN